VDKPIYVLAPMANITTYPFASQCIKYGADLVWTPMVHTDTIINNWSEARKILDYLLDSGELSEVDAIFAKSILNGNGGSDEGLPKPFPVAETDAIHRLTLTT
jgi:tRNA-dihydrouridine synthase